MITNMNYKDAQYLCAEAKREYLHDSTRKIVDEVKCDASYSDDDTKVEKLLKEHFKTMGIVNEVLDKLHHEFWVCYEDK